MRNFCYATRSLADNEWLAVAAGCWLRAAFCVASSICSHPVRSWLDWDIKLLQNSQNSLHFRPSTIAVRWEKDASFYIRKKRLLNYMCNVTYIILTAYDNSFFMWTDNTPKALQHTLHWTDIFYFYARISDIFLDFSDGNEYSNN